MPKPRHRSDANAGEIKADLELCGAHVVPLESPVAGQPDLIVGFLGNLYLLEVKSRYGRLGEGQRKAHRAWARAGVQVHTVKTRVQAREAVGITGPRAEANREAMREMAAWSQKPPRRQAGAANIKLVSSRRDHRPTSAWEDAWKQSHEIE